MNALEAATRIARGFDADGIRYAIGGALALGVWGAPRATVDVDITAFASRDALPTVLDSLERVGVMVDRVAAGRDVERIGLLKGRLGRIVVDVFVSEHPQYAEMDRRSIEIPAPDGAPLRFISAEDLSIHKLVYGRPKDIADLENMIATRATFDYEYVRSWLSRMVPAGDRRHGILDDLQRRFSSA